VLSTRHRHSTSLCVADFFVNLLGAGMQVESPLLPVEYLVEQKVVSRLVDLIGPPAGPDGRASAAMILEGLLQVQHDHFTTGSFFLLAGSGGSALLSRGAKLTLVGRPRLSQNGYCSEFPDAPTAPLVEQLAAAECTDKLVRFLRLPLLLFFLSTRFIDLLVLCVPACLLANLLPSVLCQSVLFCRFCF
jgi:hypothetical protein